MSKDFSNLSLPIEIVPQSSHYNNLRSLLKQSQWNKLRKDIIPPLENKCEICGGSSYKRSLDLHEVWSYDINSGIQKLERLEGLCTYCHEVKHYFLANTRGHYKRARNRLKKINDFNDFEVDYYEKKVFSDYIERSSIEWSLDVSLIDKYSFK